MRTRVPTLQGRERSLVEPCHILVVDDDCDIRELVAELLIEAGYAVNTAAHGVEALETLNRQPGGTDLILLDLMMPVMNGWQFLTRKRDDDAIKNIPVLVVTANPNEEVRRLDHVVGLLSKPISFDGLLAYVEHWCAASARS